ncbi:MAG: PD40 domain-containing protein [Bacteroidia bacterium]|nr:PD40 domain-containing protein [Bacteroidia bacterium]
MKYLYLFLFIAGTSVVYAQSAIEKGDLYFDFFHYKEASKEYEKALKKERTYKNEAHLLTNLAYSYLYTFQYGKALNVFEELVKIGDKKPNEQVYLDYANLLKIIGNYPKAKEQFKYYGTLTKKSGYVMQLERSLNWAIKHNDSINKKVLIAKTNIDVSGQSLGYTLFDNGIIYAQAKDTNYSEYTTLFDLRFAKQIDSVTFKQEQEYVGLITFPFNEGSPAISADGQVLYFSATTALLKKGKPVVAKEISNDGVSNLKIYSAELVNGEFTNITEMPFNHKDYSNITPFISEDGNTLYFASDMPGGYGGLDIYRCNKLGDGRWSSPINLGDKINTKEHDSYPFIIGNKFYFTSKGHLGFGGYDIFEATIAQNAVFSDVRNMGKPINSSKDDVALIFNKDKSSGYLSSNRDDANGFDYVYYFNTNYMPPPVVTTILAQTDSVKNQETIAANFTNSNSSSQKNSTSSSNDKLKQKDVHTHSKPEPHTAYFEFDSYQATSEDLNNMQLFADYWKQHKNQFIKLKAFADCRGNAAYNYKLATKRATTFYNQLVKLGVNSNKILIVSIGENESLKECITCSACTDQQHAKNRRVEVIIK